MPVKIMVLEVESNTTSGYIILLYLTRCRVEGLHVSAFIIGYHQVIRFKQGIYQ
jgi:hypothetical protein